MDNLKSYFNGANDGDLARMGRFAVHLMSTIPTKREVLLQLLKTSLDKARGVEAIQLKGFAFTNKVIKVEMTKDEGNDSRSGELELFVNPEAS
jgi:hypothetical protein